ncbi:MAG: GntR family transcriptional regulator [Candidatus Accumulibacter sp.]|nr:GntR family transcriptional regulator [Accumulibacter sp.]
MKKILKKSPPAKWGTRGFSQNEIAYASVKERIMSLVYRPGLYLNTAELMHELSLGRTPLNHALHRLSRDGLIHIIPRKGVMVVPLSIDDALELIDVRIANERLCARLAAEKITTAQLEQMAQLLDEFDAAVADNKIEVAASLDLRFHEEIAETAGNRVLMEILKGLHARSLRFWAISFKTEGHLGEIQLEHRRILETLGKRDPEAASAAMETHALSFKRSLLQAG